MLKVYYSRGNTKDASRKKFADGENKLIAICGKVYGEVGWESHRECRVAFTTMHKEVIKDQSADTSCSAL